MKRAVLVSCACLLAAPVAAQTGTADKKLLKETARTMVEDRTRQDFEEAQNKVSQRDKDAMDAIKILFYNKAYITMCASFRSAAKSLRIKPLPNVCRNR
ncbi:MAG: hypothetical protein WBL48_19440 [Pseudolabrys sp.]